MEQQRQENGKIVVNTAESFSQTKVGLYRPELSILACPQPQ